jgi:hypothetical protein
LAAWWALHHPPPFECDEVEFADIPAWIRDATRDADVAIDIEGEEDLDRFTIGNDPVPDATPVRRLELPQRPEDERDAGLTRD